MPKFPRLSQASAEDSAGPSTAGSTRIRRIRVGSAWRTVSRWPSTVTRRPSWPAGRAGRGSARRRSRRRSRGSRPRRPRPGRRAGRSRRPRTPRRPAGVTCGVSRSNSSWIGPTSSSSTFSRLTMPTTLPYSSSSIARWTRFRWNSTSRWSSRSVSGRNGTLRAHLRRSSRPLLDAPGAEQVLDVDHADDGRQVVLAERVARVARLAGDPQVVLERPRQAQVDDVRARDHHPPRGLLLQVQDVLDHHPLVPRQVAAGDALGHDVPQLFFGVRPARRGRSAPGPAARASGCWRC